MLKKKLNVKNKEEMETQKSIKKEKEQQLPPTKEQLIEIRIKEGDRKISNHFESDLYYFSWITRLITVVSLIEAFSIYMNLYHYEEEERFTANTISSSLLMSMLLKIVIPLFPIQFIFKPIYDAYIKKQVDRKGDEIENKIKDLETRKEAGELINLIEKCIAPYTGGRLKNEYFTLCSILGIASATTNSPNCFAESVLVILLSLFVRHKILSTLKPFTPELEKKRDFFATIFPSPLTVQVSCQKGVYLASSTITLDVGFYNKRPRAVSPLIAAQIVKNVLLKYGFPICSIKGNTVVLTGNVNIKNIVADTLKNDIDKAFTNYINSKNKENEIYKQLTQIANAAGTICYPILDNCVLNSAQYYLNISSEFKNLITIDFIKFIFPNCSVKEENSAFIISANVPSNEAALQDCLAQIEAVAKEIEKKHIKEESIADKETNKEGKSESIDKGRNPNKRLLKENEEAPNTSKSSVTSVDFGKGIVYDSTAEDCPVTKTWGKNAPPNYYSFFALKENDFTGHDGKIMHKKFREQHNSGHFATSDEGQQGIVLFNSFRESRDFNGEKFLANAELKAVGDFGSTGNHRVFGRTKSALPPNGNAKVIEWISYEEDAHKNRNDY